MDPLIINAAITGMVPTKSDNPHVPITVQEIIDEACRCREAGASIVHVHARDEDGQPTYRPDIFGAIIDGIRSRCPDLIISGSTSGRIHKTFEQRSSVLAFSPEFASLTLGSLNFPRQASVNEPQMIQRLATEMRHRGIVPELEIFDLGMTDYARYLVDRGVLVRPLYANILLGSLGTLSASAFNLATVIRNLPEGTTWSATGIGRFQYEVNALAVVMGGHVRVGLEDALYYDAAKTRQATNVGLIRRVVDLAAAYGRPIAQPDEARRIIGLPARAAVSR